MLETITERGRRQPETSRLEIRWGPRVDHRTRAPSRSGDQARSRGDSSPAGTGGGVAGTGGGGGMSSEFRGLEGFGIGSYPSFAVPRGGADRWIG